MDTETFEGYVKLLACSDGSFIESSDTDELLAFLYEHGRESRFNVFWNLSFDSGAIIKQFVVAHADELRKRHYRKIELMKRTSRLDAKVFANGSTPESIRDLKALKVELDGMETVERFDTGRFHVQLVGAKGMGIRPLDKRSHHKGRGTVWCFDAAAFYVEGHGGMKLETAASRYLGAHKSDKELGIDRARIGSEAGYYEAHRDDILAYCVQDASLTARLMERTVSAFANLGYGFPDKPFSKGSVSKQLLRDRGALATTIPQYQKLRLSAYRDLWLRSFQGGVFLLRGAGHFDNVYNLDLNSAYPWALRQFPSLEGAEPILPDDPRWNDPRTFFRFYRIRLAPTPRTPMKPKASLRKIYGFFEEPAVLCVTEPDLDALRAWGEPFEVVEAVGIFCPSADLPFDFLDEVFRQKTEAKKTYGGDSVEYLGIKIVANGLYGIIAQRRPRESQFTNMIYASYTTALCRRELWRAAKEIEDSGDAVLQYATDGLLVEDKSGGAVRALWKSRDTEALGGWSFDDGFAVTLFETGVYVKHLADGSESLKKRGAPDLTVAALKECAENKWVSHRSAPVKTKTAIIRNMADLLGVFISVDREILPARSFADAEQKFPRGLRKAPLSSYFYEHWYLALRGEKKRW